MGHARTFWIAAQRAIQQSGTLLFRNEDLDPQRCRPEFVTAMFDDLHWLGIRWSEGPDTGGPYTPYSQSECREFYLHAWRQLRDDGFIYPCTCSRKDLAEAASAPNDADDEPIYPGRCRNRTDAVSFKSPGGTNWRFRVPDGEAVTFNDRHFGMQRFLAGSDFGDFVVWRRDDVPSYQLAVVADDARMHITEVVRGQDLLKSTARQLLLYAALRWPPPSFYHCELVRDESGQRLAKRHDALSLRAVREAGITPQQLITRWDQDPHEPVFLG